jgi:hypothetical protein
MISVYHGTSKANTDIITSEGFRPRSGNGNWTTPGKVKSHPEMVYFAKSTISASFFALRTAVAKKEKECAVLKVNLNAYRLYPDENTFAEIAELIPPSRMEEYKSFILKNKKKWRDGFKSKGLVCHRGIVPIDSIEGYWPGKIEDNPWYFLIADVPDADIVKFDKRFHLLSTAENLGHITYCDHLESYRFEENADGTTTYFGFNRQPIHFARAWL